MLVALSAKLYSFFHQNSRKQEKKSGTNVVLLSEPRITAG